MTADATMQTPLVSYTLFEDTSAQSKIERCDMPWTDLVERIEHAPEYPRKADCPLISLAEYGDVRSGRNCLRHGANVRRIFGLEADYDGEIVPLERAAALLDAARLEATLYTSPSHTPAKPRWRVLLPLGDPEIPDKRAEYVAKVNRVLGGILSRESFTLSQSYYIGRVRGSEYRTAVTHGRTIDQATEIEPLYFSGNGNGGESDRDSTTDAELRARFDRGEDRYQAMLKLSARWAARGMAVDDIEAALLELLGTGSLNGEGIDLRTKVRPLAESAVRKYGETRKTEGTKSDAPAEPSEPKPNPFLTTPIASDWLTVAPPPQEFLIDAMVPVGGVTLFAAQSGTGKSTLAIDAAIGVASGYGWLGLGSLSNAIAIYFALEDGADVARRRIYWIAKRRREQIRYSFGDQAAEQFEKALQSRLFVKSLLEFDVQLIAETDGVIIQTYQVDQIRAAVLGMAAGRPALLTLDPLLNLHAGDGNAETVGKTLIRAIAGITQAGPSIAALLPAHTSKHAIREGEVTALAVRGSMALVDSARSVIVGAKVDGTDKIRRLFDTATVPDAELPTANIVTLMHAKSNYGKAAAPLYAIFRDGAFDPLVPNGQEGDLYRRRLDQWRTWFASPAGKPRSRKALVERLRGEIWPALSKREAEGFIDQARDDGDAVEVMGEVRAGQEAKLLQPRAIKE